MKSLKTILILLCIFLTISCSVNYKTFRHGDFYDSVFGSGHNTYLYIGNNDNKLFGRYDLNDSLLIGDFLYPFSFREEIKEILLKALPQDYPYQHLKDKQQIDIILYFDPKTLKVMEVYFSFLNTKPYEIFNKKELVSMENHIKKNISATINPHWGNSKRVKDQLSNSRFIDYSTTFRIRQLFEVRDGILPEDRLLIF